MTRIAGINIPQNKVVRVGLTYIYGIGDKHSHDICKNLNIPSSKRVNQLTDDEILKIREYIDKNFDVEGELRRETSLNIKRLIDLATYRGSRHKKKLPVRGQRTRCNARTRKGKAIAIAGKNSNPLYLNKVDNPKSKAATTCHLKLCLYVAKPATNIVIVISAVNGTSG